MPEEPWTEVPYLVKKAGIKTIPKENKRKKAKWLSEEGLQIAEKIREAKGKRERERYTQLNPEFQRKAWKNKKAFVMRRNRGKQQNGKD